MSDNTPDGAQGRLDSWCFCGFVENSHNARFTLFDAFNTFKNIKCYCGAVAAHAVIDIACIVIQASGENAQRILLHSLGDQLCFN